jgi:hypothetical protein
MRNNLWFKGTIESGTITYEDERGLVVERGLTDHQIQFICQSHNRIVENIEDRVKEEKGQLERAMMVIEAVEKAVCEVIAYKDGQKGS